jgi:hypothetical protein
LGFVNLPDGVFGLVAEVNVMTGAEWIKKGLGPV